MAKNRMVNTRIRSDGRVLDLDPSEKLLRVYLITNDHTDLCGIYEIHTRVICMETGFDKDMVNKIIDRFEKDGKIKRFENRIHIINFSKHQVKNPSVKLGIERSLKLIPKYIIDSLYPDGLQTVVLNLDLTKPNLNLTKGEEVEEKQITKFKKPSIKEIEDYCIKRKNNISSIKFYNHYESIGWLVGKNKMKNWKACIITREENEKKYNNGTPNTKGPSMLTPEEEESFT